MAEVLNKKELAEKLADEFELTKKAAGEQIQFLLDVVTSELEKGNTVDLSGFGKFVVKEKAAHEGINPATMEKITIAAKKAVAFKPAKALKENVK
ncbi:MAG: HU family DNA-binding protein [Erysipelotrichaceae bacterium]|nr:HU family DNA-binding protein [Erysipelotrichaceae bacterium]